MVVCRTHKEINKLEELYQQYKVCICANRKKVYLSKILQELETTIRNAVQKCNPRNDIEREDMLQGGRYGAILGLRSYDVKKGSVKTKVYPYLIKHIILARHNPKKHLLRLRLNKAKKSLLNKGVKDFSEKDLKLELKKQKVMSDLDAINLELSETLELSEDKADSMDEEALEEIIKFEEYRTVREEIERLPALTQEIILKRLEGVSWVKLAAQLKISMYKARKDYADGFAQLKKSLKEKLDR